MARRCIAHIGIHKTGSTSIQQSLHRNPTLQGGHYIDLGTPNGSMKLQALFTTNPARLRSVRAGRLDEAALAALNQETRRSLGEGLALPVEQVLISGESMSAFTPAEVRALHALLASHVEEVQAIAYVRSTQGWIDSAFQQNIKRTGPPSFDLSACVARLAPAYRERLEPYDQVFGRDNVRLLPFAPERFAQGCVVRDFCHQTGLSLDPATIVRSNDSLSRNAIAVLWRFWRHVGEPNPQHYGVCRHLAGALMPMPGAKFRFSPELVAPALAARRADLDWIEARLGTGLSAVDGGRPGDVRTEADLMHIDEAGQDWLARLLGPKMPARLDPDSLGPLLIELSHAERKRQAALRRQAGAPQGANALAED